MNSKQSYQDNTQEAFSTSKNLPKYFDSLTLDDQKKYLELQSYLSSKECRNNRGFRLNKFSEMLTAIQQYCTQDFKSKSTEENARRFLVCGVCWLQHGIAINTRQLRLLIDKCKSSINGSLKRMGYSSLAIKNEMTDDLIAQIPFLKSSFTELREWSIRQQSAMTPQPDINMNFGALQTIPHSISLSPEPRIERTEYSSLFGSNFISPNKNQNADICNISEAGGKYQKENKINGENGSNTHSENDFGNDFDDFNGIEHSQDNYFDDPFCLPPTCVFDDEDPFQLN